MPWCGRACLAASLLLACLAGGCSSNSGTAEPGPPASDAMHGYSGSGTLTDMFFASSPKSPQTASGAQPDINCPPVEVRQGASALTIGPNDNKSAMSVRYQGDFTREARECAVANGYMVMRVGVQGRIIVGPAGGPGQVDVPLRIAVVQETPAGLRPIMTKFVRIPVTIGADLATATFSHIEEGVSFPLPMPTSALDDYVAYVGFDPLAADAQDRPKPVAKPKPKARPRPAASVN